MKIDFNNTQIAFASLSNKELRKVYLLFKTISSPSFVKIGSAMVNLSFKIHFPIKWAVKPTIYKHFVGGEDIPGSEATIKKLQEYNIKSILDYSVEGKEQEAEINLGFEETLRSIKKTSEDPCLVFAVFKPTAMGQSISLEKASLKKALNEKEEAEVAKFKERVHLLCEAAYKADTRILIDAEDSWFQDLIDETVDHEMELFNKEKAIVWNTFQMYRHDRLDFLKKSYEKAKAGNYYLGAKFVRGAYMEKEREAAQKGGYPDPIQKDKAATDRDFNAALLFCLENLDRISVFCGTHNEESNQYFADQMEKLGIAKNHPQCWFSQLYGMSDHISYNLAKEDYNVAKYLPYGPIKDVLPYLLRRAQENTSTKGQTGRELKLIQAEKLRRKKAK